MSLQRKKRTTKGIISWGDFEDISDSEFAIDSETHSPETPNKESTDNYQCSHCDEKTKTLTGFKRHLKSVHDVNEPEKSVVSVNSQLVLTSQEFDN